MDAYLTFVAPPSEYFSAKSPAVYNYVRSDFLPGLRISTAFFRLIFGLAEFTRKVENPVDFQNYG